MKTYPNFPIGTEVQLRTKDVVGNFSPWLKEKYIIENSRKREGKVIYYIHEVGQDSSYVLIAEEECLRAYPGLAHCNRKHELHNHPIWERNLKLGDKHVIIDRAEFDKLNRTRYNGNEVTLCSNIQHVDVEIDRSRYIHRGFDKLTVDEGKQDLTLKVDDCGLLSIDARNLMSSGPFDIIIRKACK